MLGAKTIFAPVQNAIPVGSQFDGFMDVYGKQRHLRLKRIHVWPEAFPVREHDHVHDSGKIPIESVEHSRLRVLQECCAAIIGREDRELPELAQVILQAFVRRWKIAHLHPFCSSAGEAGIGLTGKLMLSAAVKYGCYSSTECRLLIPATACAPRRPCLLPENDFSLLGRRFPGDVTARRGRCLLRNFSGS